jgi:tetratricopeptide (TPR) repeat protein
VPEHDLAKRQVSRLRARILSREAGDLAQARRLEAAVARYGQALELDPESARLHGGRGMALAELGRLADAVPDLEAALRLGDEDPALASMLAYGLLQAGRSADARRVLSEALARRPHDVGLAGNLARLLATDPDPAVRDPALALRLALEVEQATVGRDPRALDTLAAAYAASGDTARALEACARGVAAARGKGDSELASAIEARARGLRRPR